MRLDSALCELAAAAGGYSADAGICERVGGGGHRAVHSQESKALEQEEQRGGREAVSVRVVRRRIIKYKGQSSMCEYFWLKP